MSICSTPSLYSHSDRIFTVLVIRLLNNLTVIAALASAAAGATISGKVKVPASTESSSQPGSGYSRGVYSPTHKSSGENAGHTSKKAVNIIIWAEPTGDIKAPFHKPAKKPTIIQQNNKFVPHVLVVQTGSVVDFPNLDPLYHNVFSYSRAKRFDLGRYEQGKSKAISFDQPGVIDVFCEIHEDMHAYLLVLDTPWFTSAGTDGSYELKVPAGAYRVFAWIPARRSEPVELSLEESSSRTVDFSF